MAGTTDGFDRLLEQRRHCHGPVPAETGRAGSLPRRRHHPAAVSADHEHLAAMGS